MKNVNEKQCSVVGLQRSVFLCALSTVPVRCFFDRPKIFIEPVESFLVKLCFRKVSFLDKQMFLILSRCAERIKHRFLRFNDGENIVILAVNHQHRHFNMRCEIDLVNFRPSRLNIKRRTDQNAGFYPLLDCRHNCPKSRTPAPAEVCYFIMLNIIATLEVINRATQVFRPGDNEVSVSFRGTRTIRG